MLGGLILTNGITNATLYSTVEILVIFTDIFFLRDEGDTKVERDSHPLQPGKYYITATSPFSVNNEPWLVRTISQATETCTQSFCDAVRSRDGRCIISGKEAINADIGFCWGFETAHIFPLAYESYWIEHHYSDWITISPGNGGTINSVQNSLLLKGDIHQLFDNYGVSINPDDNYKIVFFIRDSDGLAGKNLDQKFLDDPQRPVDQLLRWHFRQAVLANIRVAGKPIFEHDFPPDSDIVGDILHGPKAAERMEFELFSRISSVMER